MMSRAQSDDLTANSAEDEQYAYEDVLDFYLHDELAETWRGDDDE